MIKGKKKKRKIMKRLKKIYKESLNFLCLYLLIDVVNLPAVQFEFSDTSDFGQFH